MESLSVRDVLLFGFAAYLAVIALVRLMLAQRNVVTRQVATEIELERQRQRQVAAEKAASEKDTPDNKQSRKEAA